MNICEKAALAADTFEKTNTELKRQYLQKNIDVINNIMSRVPGYCGSFGTGYPFYVLNPNLEGELPVIDEQIRYNDELLEAAKGLGNNWPCELCLASFGNLMPDLKQICKPCPEVNPELKPRKILNRLPDVDMWMVCSDAYVEKAKTTLAALFDSFGMKTSDVDPIQTIHDVEEIANDLKDGRMPTKMLPLDVHIIEYSKLYRLISEVPFTLQNASFDNRKPYLPIHPISLRKTWQYDDEAYNFILDFMFSLTPFNWEKSLERKLTTSRHIISQFFSPEELEGILQSVAPDSVKRRLETEELQKTYKKRVDLWRRK